MELITKKNNKNWRSLEHFIISMKVKLTLHKILYININIYYIVVKTANQEKCVDNNINKKELKLNLFQYKEHWLFPQAGYFPDQREVGSKKNGI